MAFTNAQYDELMSSYYTNQTENRALENSRKEEVYAAVPRIKEIDQLLAISSIDAVRAKLRGQADHTDSAKEKNHTLVAEKADLLKVHGFSADYLQPIYTCTLCKDTGRIDGEYCPCFKQAWVSMLYKESTLEHLLETENFDTFDLNYYSKESDGTHPFTPYENMSNILNKSKSFVETFDKEGGNLLFYGETGVGKTFLSSCIAKALMDTHHTVLYQSAIHLFEDVCGDVIMKKGDNPIHKEIYNYLFRCDLLIIDDLGTEFTNSFVISQLYDILNTRMRAKKSTIISTNLSLHDLTETYTDRISTRIIASYTAFPFYGENVRLAKKRKMMQG